jgi:outer membrane protein
MKHFLIAIAPRLLAGLLLVLGGLPRAQAQAQETKTSFTLTEAIDYAVTNSLTVKNAQLEIGKASAQVGQTRAIGLPQVNGTLDVSHSPVVQKAVLDNEPGFLFNPDLPPGAPIVLAFQAQNSAIMTLGLTQLVFDGQYIVGLQAAATFKQLSEKAYISSKITVAENVTKAYYGVLVNQERAKLLDVNIARLDSTLRQTQAMFKQGMIERIDVDRIEVQLNNLKAERLKAVNGVNVTYYLLKLQMNFPQSQTITLTDELANMKVDQLPPAAPSYNNRIEYSLLQTQLAGDKLQLKNVRYGYLPSLGVSANLGANTSSNKFSNLTVSDRWFNYSLIGARLSLPVYDGFNKRYQAQQKKLSIEQTQNSIKQLEQSIDFQVNQGNATYANSIESLRNQERNLVLAREVSRVAKIKYQRGVGSNLEVINAESDLKDAQTNYYAALYDALIARVDLDLATGTLYNK